MSEEENNIRFVQIIEKYSCLYNYNLSEYSRRDVTEKAWCDIAEETNSTVSLAKDKWKNLTSIFVRKRKLPPSGPGKKGKPYYLNKYMEFIVPLIKTQNTGQGNVLPPPLSPASDTIVEQVVENDKMAEQDHSLVERNKILILPPPLLFLNLYKENENTKI
ncbi:uncharacterized protein LOC115883776 [Sitophilus oryzae]|uniref:Uncharacterized protein LOC115883776 n=1 Tax=Sitophilus oryzae TaxID=7048 RepID=A0A6J2Y2W1_SITOR|nr:uncharacterized protein LOC115883776 [Sitophilus oryzae]